MLFTSDNQVTVIVPEGSIARRTGTAHGRAQRGAAGPGHPAPAGHDLTVFGNAYAISATYQPSGKRVTEVRGTARRDPGLPGDRDAARDQPRHALQPPTGRRWETLDSPESLQQQQSEATVPGFGTVTVAGVRRRVTDAGAGLESGRTTLAIVLLVLAGCALLVGIGLLLRSRRLLAGALAISRRRPPAVDTG